MSKAARRLHTIHAHLNGPSEEPSGVAGSPVRGKNVRRSPPKLPLVLLPEVAQALECNRPVVALESTIISHGMPFPQNLETAREVERVVRENGAVPATIAILDGVVHVGLSEEGLEKLARAGKKVNKTSRRDLAAVVAGKLNGATTVSGTSYIANLVGISVFATGGIGGVHRGGEVTMDVSADLTELGRTPIAVVCAGAKSLLDIGRTLEFLETQGVAVVGYGTDEFPAFFTPHSGHKTSCRMDTPEQCARLIHAGKALRLKSGMVIGVPIRKEDAAEASMVEKAIQQAIKEADDKKIHGNDVTPFLLQRVNELTGGESLKSNICLIKQNAKVAAQIAAALSRVRAEEQNGSSRKRKTGRPIIVGGVAMDISARPYKGQAFIEGTSNPGTITHQWGGVGRNIAECMTRLSLPPLLISSVGNDELGHAYVKWAERVGMPTQGISFSDTESTGVYSATMQADGELMHAVAGMHIFKTITAEQILRFRKDIKQSAMVVVDGNISENAMRELVTACAEYNTEVWFEPTSVVKSTLPIEAGVVSHLTYISPNVEELNAMAAALDGSDRGTSQDVSPGRASVTEPATLTPSEDPSKDIDAVLRNGAKLLKAGVKNVIVTMGAAGAILLRLRGETIEAHHFHPDPSRAVVHVTGAGDCFVGGVVWALLTRCAGDIDRAVPYGMAAAKYTVEWDGPVSPRISEESVTAAVHVEPSQAQDPGVHSNFRVSWRHTYALINTESS